MIIYLLTLYVAYQSAPFLFQKTRKGKAFFIERPILSDNCTVTHLVVVFNTLISKEEEEKEEEEEEDDDDGRAISFQNQASRGFCSPSLSFSFPLSGARARARIEENLFFFGLFRVSLLLLL